MENTNQISASIVVIGGKRYKLTTTIEEIVSSPLLPFEVPTPVLLRPSAPSAPVQLVMAPSVDDREDGEDEEDDGEDFDQAALNEEDDEEIEMEEGEEPIILTPRKPAPPARPATVAKLTPRQTLIPRPAPVTLSKKATPPVRATKATKEVQNEVILKKILKI